MTDLQHFLDNVHDLTDLELAVLLSLIAQQSCLIFTEDDLVDDLSSELALIASEVFKLSYAVVSAEECTSVEKFAESVLDENHDHDFGANPPSSEDYLLPHSRLASVNVRAGSITPSRVLDSDLDSRAVVNVIIARNFNHASREVQVAALELITRRRIYSRTTVHHVPKTFLFIPIVSTSTKHVRLNIHLNDRISMSHYHGPADGFANLEELNPDFFDSGSLVNHSHHPPRLDRQSTRSSISSSSASHSFTPQQPQQYQNDKTNPTHNYKNNNNNNHLDSNSTPTGGTIQIHHSLIETLRTLGDAATITPEIRRHTQDIVVFLRSARGVDTGITPAATTELVKLSRYLAPLHGLDFVTPGLVALAARKVYPHRIVLARPVRERSVQWGSDLDAVRALFDGMTPESVVDEVLATVPSPV